MKQMPVSSVGPLMTRAGVILGWRALRSACTASKVSRSMIGGTGHDDDLADGLQLLGLGALVELVLADIGRAGQDAMNLRRCPSARRRG